MVKMPRIVKRKKRAQTTRQSLRRQKLSISQYLLIAWQCGIVGFCLVTSVTKGWDALVHYCRRPFELEAHGTRVVWIWLPQLPHPLVFSLVDLHETCKEGFEKQPVTLGVEYVHLGLWNRFYSNATLLKIHSDGWWIQAFLLSKASLVVETRGSESPPFGAGVDWQKTNSHQVAQGDHCTWILFHVFSHVLFCFHSSRLHNRCFGDLGQQF